jgi:hypothetical protein
MLYDTPVSFIAKLLNKKAYMSLQFGFQSKLKKKTLGMVFFSSNRVPFLASESGSLQKHTDQS